VFVVWLGACARPVTPVSSTTPAEAAPVPSARPEPAPAAARYDLAAGSARIVRSLKGTIEVDAYVMRGQPQLDEVTSELEGLLAAYEREGQGKLKFRLIEANSYELREQAKADGLQEQPFWESNESDPKTTPDAQGYLGLVFRYGSEKAVIPALPVDTTGLEFWVTNKIREIRDKADDVKHRIGVITGKKELKLSDTNLVPKSQLKGGGPSIESIIEQAFPFYRIEPVELKRGTSAIDPELAGLIITQPQEDYSEPELRRIDEFLLRGKKSLVVFASAVNLRPSDSKLDATLSTRGLEPLLDGYGIHMNQDAVFDHGAQFRVQVQTLDSQPVWLRHPAIAHVISDPALEPERRLLDNGFAPFFRIDELILPFASSLRLMRDKQPTDVTLRVVARSTPATTVETTGPVSMKLRERWTPKPPVEQRVLVAYAQGKLQSAFVGKPLTEPRVPERAPNASRVLVISSSQFLTNPFAYAGNGAGTPDGDPKLLALAQPYTKYLTMTILVVKNTLDWMIGEEDLISLSAKVGTRRKH
jgi:ABC-type uncharacterized transport system involved in gliding motility auxiliary subunit